MKIKYYTHIEIIDIETGEILTKSMFERRNMRVIKKEKTTTYKTDKDGTKYGEIRIRWLTREHEQQRLFT